MSEFVRLGSEIKKIEAALQERDRYREALEEIVFLEEREGDRGEGPGYWGAIGEAADIARRGLGEQQ